MREDRILHNESTVGNPWRFHPPLEAYLIGHWSTERGPRQTNVSRTYLLVSVRYSHIRICGILSSSAVSSDELLDPPLFSFIRDRYQIIVEELMERKEPADKALFDFKVRQNSGAFLCHNQNCPRAVQGFRTSELRQEHAKSHRPRFQCVHAPCGFFGTTFNTRAAMNKHATQYHDEETTASVPDSLIRKSRVSPKDRSLFTFTEVKTKRKTEDFSPPLISVTKNPQLAAGHLLQQQQYLHAQQLLQQEQQQQQQQQQLYAQQQQRHQQLQQQLQQQQLQQQHQQQLQQQIQQQQIQRIQAAQNRLLSNNENGNNESQPKELLFQPPMYPSMQPEFPSTNPPLPSSLPPVRYLETNYTDKDSLNASASQETEPLLPSIDFADSRMGKISLEDYLDNLDASVSQETKALLPGIDSADSSLDPLLAVGPSLEGYVPDSSLFGEDWSKTNSPQPTPEEPRPQLPPLTAGLPQRSTFSDLLQVANTGHLTAKSVPPVADTSTQRSPFRESSQYAEDQGVPHDWAAPSRQEQELGANAQADASRASPLPSITSLQRPPDSPIMSDPKLMSLMEGVKKRFWHARRHLQQDEIELQWAPRTARSSSIDYPVPGEIFPPYEEVEPLFMGLEDTT